ncbi:helix-turn-helix domain-containing protein [Streptomyces tailanensis]|uniref:helix-turn-helix domain-containing protein n=1 Tax=Streptomyces tailanensis TaxID=2569858 RepID=UPI001FE9F7B7|nr:hypothetical protein [Streptomyces tailanensis]
MNPEPPVTSDASEAVTPEALRKQYESGATIDELVATSGLSYGTVLNRLHDAGTEMRTSWQTRRMREDPQARQRLAAHLRTLYEEHGATLTELAAAAGETRRAARRLLIEAGGTVRTTQQTLRMRSAARAVERQKLAVSLRARYKAGATVPDLAQECNYSVATVYRLLHQAGTRMRPQHTHSPAHEGSSTTPSLKFFSSSAGSAAATPTPTSLTVTSSLSPLMPGSVQRATRPASSRPRRKLHDRAAQSATRIAHPAPRAIPKHRISSCCSVTDGSPPTSSEGAAQRPASARSGPTGAETGNRRLPVLDHLGGDERSPDD